MDIALAQISPLWGDFEGNSEMILKAYQRACEKKARVLFTPEYSLSGFPHGERIGDPDFSNRSRSSLEGLISATRGKKTALAVGTVERRISGPDHSESWVSVYSVIEDGIVIFSEDSHKERSSEQDGSAVDLWHPHGEKEKVAVFLSDRLWAPLTISDEVLSEYKKQGVDWIIIPSPFPYRYQQKELLFKASGEVAKNVQKPLIVLNLWGAEEGNLWEGSSWIFNSQGDLKAQMKSFSDDFLLVDSLNMNVSTADALTLTCTPSSTSTGKFHEELDRLIEALTMGIRENFKKAGFKLAIVGLSGGIDSSLVSALAVRALGEKNVFGVSMPSQYSSLHSITDAEDQAKRMGIPFEVRPIKFIYSTTKKEIASGRGELASIALENLQARLRGIVLMTLSNHYGALVLETGNKSENSVGYCTLYGDTCGAFAPIGDLYKTQVYEVARRLNEQASSCQKIPPIPESILQKAPSAELREGQKDTDTLPPYPQLDPFLEDYWAKKMSTEELIRKHGEWVPFVIRMIKKSAFKRKQVPFSLNVSCQ